MVLGAPFGSTLEKSIRILLGLVLGNYFGIWEGSLVGVSLGPPDGLIIGTVEGSLVGLSLRLTLGSPLEYPNTGDKIPDTLMSASLGLCFGSELVLG